MIYLLLFFLVIFPSICNLVLLFLKPLKRKWKIFFSVLELTYIVLGMLFDFLFCTVLLYTGDWFEQLYNTEKHIPIFTKAYPTFAVIVIISIIAYVILKFVKTSTAPPLFSVILISLMYLGIIELILWCVQLSKNPQILFCLFPINLIIVFVRTIRNAVLEKLNSENTNNQNSSKLSAIFNNAKNWPWVALVLAIPLLGVMLIVLLLFGQKPDYIIKMWTETADWTMSTKIPPQNIYQDQHYLCTVAAGGHRKIVKPLRVGIRYGHRVVVNRQLMIANAFEQLLEERLPKFHKIVRTTYDNIGYPIAKHIKSPFVADVIYFLMKPLEWIFLIVLYLFDTKPENRIAVQYPHSNPPIVR